MASSERVAAWPLQWQRKCPLLNLWASWSDHGTQSCLGTPQSLSLFHPSSLHTLQHSNQQWQGHQLQAWELEVKAALCWAGAVLVCFVKCRFPRDTDLYLPASFWRWISCQPVDHEFQPGTNLQASDRDLEVHDSEVAYFIFSRSEMNTSAIAFHRPNCTFEIWASHIFTAAHFVVSWRAGMCTLNIIQNGWPTICLKMPWAPYDHCVPNSCLQNIPNFTTILMSVKSVATHLFKFQPLHLFGSHVSPLQCLCMPQKHSQQVMGQFVLLHDLYENLGEVEQLWIVSCWSCKLLQSLKSFIIQFDIP